MELWAKYQNLMVNLRLVSLSSRNNAFFDSCRGLKLYLPAVHVKLFTIIKNLPPVCSLV